MWERDGERGTCALLIFLPQLFERVFTAVHADAHRHRLAAHVLAPQPVVGGQERVDLGEGVALYVGESVPRADKSGDGFDPIELLIFSAIA